MMPTTRTRMLRQKMHPKTPLKPMIPARRMNPPVRRKRKGSSASSFLSVPRLLQAGVPSFRNLVHHLPTQGNPLTCVLGSRTFLLKHFLLLAGSIAPSGEGITVPFRILLADDSMTAQKMGKKILTDA